jgi:hypothetical protein
VRIEYADRQHVGAEKFFAPTQQQVSINIPCGMALLPMHVPQEAGARSSIRMERFRSIAMEHPAPTVWNTLLHTVEALCPKHMERSVPYVWNGERIIRMERRLLSPPCHQANEAIKEIDSIVRARQFNQCAGHAARFQKQAD